MTFWINPDKRKPVEPGTLIENTRLKIAFEKHRQYQTEYYTRKVLTEIRCTNFLILITTDGMSYAQVLGKADLEPDQKICMIGVQSNNGDWYQPLFSDADEIKLQFKEQSEDIRIINIDIEWMIRLLINEPGREGLVINPGSDNWVIHKDHMEWYIRNVV